MIKATINTILLFLGAALFPLGSFVLPAYKIKTMPNLNQKEKLISNIVIAIVILIFSPKLFCAYVGVFLVIEGLYYTFNKTYIKVFDRILISTIVTTIIGYFLMRVFIGTPQDLIIKITQSYQEHFPKIDKTILQETMGYIERNFIFVIFIYLLVINYFTYFLVDGKSYRKWKISYQWVILYIVTFFIGKVLKIDNFYVKNIHSISALIYVIYGVKVLYSMLRLKIKLKIYGKILAIVTACFFPIIVFILGVLNSFELVKIKIRRK